MTTKCLCVGRPMLLYLSATRASHLIRLLMSTSFRRALPAPGPPDAGTVRLCRSSSCTLPGSEVGAWHVKFWHTNAAGLQGALRYFHCALVQTDDTFR